MPGAYLSELLGGDPALPVTSDGYGLGVRVLATPLGVAYGHGGEFPGYLSFVLYLPMDRLAVALQTNTAQTDANFLRESALALAAIVRDARAPLRSRAGARAP